MTVPDPALVAACGATVLRARARRLAKTIRPDGEVVGYDRARTFDLLTVRLAGPADLHVLLLDLAGRPDRALARGAPADPRRTAGVRRLLRDDAATGEAATLREVPRRWLALDLDGLPLPAGADPRDMAACARAALHRLPAAFQDAVCVVQATAGHGIKPGARLRLWFWLSRPATGAELAVWLAGAPVDRCVFRPAQPIYTAAPVFAAGAADPLPARTLALAGGRDAVRVPPPAALAPVRRAPPPPRPRPEGGGSRYAAAALSRAADAIRRGAVARHPLAVREALGMTRLIRAGLLTRAEVVRAFRAALAVPGRGAAEDEAEGLVAWGLAHADDRPLPGGGR